MMSTAINATNHLLIKHLWIQSLLCIHFSVINCILT